MELIYLAVRIYDGVDQTDDFHVTHPPDFFFFGSALFDSSMTSWNPNTLDNTLNKLSQTLPGVNSPYLYFGMWKATFAWHVEVLYRLE